MSTSGDEGVASTESPSGMKGLWVDRIVEALRSGEVDIAVHSAKDLPAEDEEDVVIAAVPKRGDPLDVLDRARGEAATRHGRRDLERAAPRAAAGRLPGDGRDRDPRERRHAAPEARGR